MVLGGSGVGQITLNPILIRKGSTAVALYGLGNIRDERLNRMFQTPHAVQWMRPEAQEGCQVSDWFNILVLHQNRIKTNPKNAINEHFLPRFLDFIVWGHEHECLVDPQEVPGMGFHITQPGSSVATSLIEGESKPKHVLLLEIKGNQYRPSKIPLNSVRPFEYAEVVLKDESEIDANDQTSVIEHLDKVVRNLIDRARDKVVSRSELRLPLIRIKVDYSGFMTINPQRFGQKYVGKVANPQDILIFSKAAKKRQSLEDRIDDSERLRPEELNQQNIEALVAESNLKMEVLPVNDLDVALQDFVNKDDKLAFYSCLQYNLEETRNKISQEADALKFEEEDLVVKVGECMQILPDLIKLHAIIRATLCDLTNLWISEFYYQGFDYWKHERTERVKERSTHTKDGAKFTSLSQSVQDTRGKTAATLGSSNSFSDDEEITQMFSSAKSATRGRKGSSAASRSSIDALEQGTSRAPTRGRGRGRGRGRSKDTVGLKQTTLDATMMTIRHSNRSSLIAASATVQSIPDDEENVDSPSSDGAHDFVVNAVIDSGNDGGFQGKGRKREAPKGAISSSKRGRKSGKSSAPKPFMSKDDDDDDDDDDMSSRLRKAQPRSDLVESDSVAMAEGPNATNPAQVLALHVGGPSVNPRPLNTRMRLDQLEEKMQALSGIIDQVTTLEERLDGFSDDQAHVGERLVTLERVVEGNMATLLDQVAELSSKSSSQSQQKTRSSNNYNRGKNGGYQARGGIDQGHDQNRSGGASTGGASSSNSGREYHRPRNNGGASSSSRFQGRPGNLKCFLCGGNHKAYQCPQKTALNALMASHGDQADDTTQGNDSGNAQLWCTEKMITKETGIGFASQFMYYAIYRRDTACEVF
ncbi:hypothetical protein GIB67_031199 [Kingdonia uniflora]|uniref:Mre11 DNA-binding domain-containing protein n=1 Tax=Kingdonia uniflora TaxID=39325 RepID=A0A7J7NKE2_9MAGN|nr:hypothetical protein GIB67_031199 [Kingdonia uniflora]